MILPLIVFVLCAIHFVKTIEKQQNEVEYLLIHSLISASLILISVILSIKWGLS